MQIDATRLSATEAYKTIFQTITPRPIAWVSTVSNDGAFNLAPFSKFTSVCPKPPTLCLSIGRIHGEKKHTLQNIEDTGVFVINIVTEALVEQMNQTSAEYPRHSSEFAAVGLTPRSSEKVSAPQVAESPIRLECRLVRTLEFGEEEAMSSLVIGEVVAIHIDDEMLVNDVVDPSRLKAVGRLGSGLFCHTSETFRLNPPDAIPNSKE